MIIGAKKGKNKQRTPHIAKDDLVSQSWLKAMYGLAEGEISGLVDGAKSIYLDETPLVGENGQVNFEGARFDFRPGSIDQSYISGFSAVENERAVSVEVRHNKQFVRAISNTSLNAVRVRLSFGALREQKQNGDIVGTSIEYAIDVQTDGGAYQEVLKTAVRGKASQGFRRSHRIDLPKARRNWTLRVRRITPNRDSELVGDSMYVEAMTEIIDAKLRYPCTALLALEYDAKTFSNIAKVAVHLKGKLIQVPTNYNPETRTYSGLWDGTFKLAYSNNPAWVFYDICTHKRYGLGDRLAGMIDKWRLYQIGQYCDELVDDGKGGKEPRFACNVYLQQADQAFQVLQNLSSVFRGMSFWDGNQIIVDSDTPKDPVYTFTRANVMGGEFNYTGTRTRDRHTVGRVGWDNPDNDYKTEYEMVHDEAAIAKYGIRQLDINAFGCTSQGQAQRAGIWALKSEQLETRTVTFKTGLQGFIPEVGQVINIADDVFAGRAISGRIVSTAAKVITLDRSAGKVGDTITVNHGGKLHSARITAVKDNHVTTDKALAVTADDTWAITSDDLKLMQFRIISITQDDTAEFTISALQYERQKYAIVDNGAMYTPSPITALKATPINAPSSVTISQSVRTHQNQSVTTMTISWAQVIGAVAYLVRWRKDDGNWQIMPAVAGQSVDIEGVYSGNYIAEVQAIDAFDNQSLATSSTLTQITGKTGKPPRLASFTAKGILFGMELGWIFNAGSGDTNYTEIQVSPDGRSNIATLGQFAYPTDKHTITGLQGNLTQHYRARIVDKLGNVSDWTAWVSGTTSAEADKVLDILSGQISQSHLDQSLRAPIAKIPTLETNISKINVDLPKINQSIADERTRINSINQQLPTLNQNIANAQKDLQAAKKELDSSINSINQQLPTLNQNIANAQSTLNTAVANIDAEKKRITSAIVDIDTLKQSNDAKTQELLNLSQTVGGHTSSIRELGVTTGELSQRYTQLKTASDNANSEITAIKQTQAGQATSIDRLGAKFDNLAVGGRNLLIHTHQPSAGIAHIGNQLSTGNVSVSYRDDILRVEAIAAANSVWFGVNSNHIKNLDNNTAYVLSGFVKSSAQTVLQSRWQSYSDQYQTIAISFDTAEDWRRFVVKFAGFNEATIANRVALFANAPVGVVFEFKQLKLEKGTIATDWTPAPEDIDAQFVQTNASISTLQQTVTNADNALSQRIDTIDASYKSADSTINASLTAEQKARTTADNALSQRITAIDTAYKSADTQANAKIATLEQSLTDKDSAMSRRVDTLQASYNTLNSTKASVASLTAEQKARTTADNALSQRITAIDTAYKSADTQANAKIATLEQSLTDKDSAMSRRVDTLQASYNTLNSTKASVASLTAEQKARADGDGSLASRMSALDSKFTTADNAIKASVAQAQQTATNAQQAVATAQSQMNAKFDNLAVGGRNYLLNSNTSRNSHGTTYLQVSPSLDVSKLRHFVLSCDVSYTNAHRATTQGAKWFRIGLELTCTYTDGSRKWFGLWKHSINNGDSFDGRISALCTVPSDKTLARIDNAIIQIWEIVADTMIVKNPKLELGTLATDWSPAPEDAQADIDQKASSASLDEFKSAQAKADQATATKISQIETAYKSADNTLIAQIASETTARTNADLALSTRIDNLSSDYNSNKASVTRQLKTLSDKDVSTSSQIDSLTANYTTVNSKADKAQSTADTANTNAQNAKRVADDALGKANTAKADIIAEQKARADGDGALSTRVDSLDVSFSRNHQATNARIAKEEQARADADSALSSRVDSLDVSFSRNHQATNARIAKEEQARADADSALSSRVDSLDVSFSRNHQATNARIAKEEQARADADSALSSRVDSLNTSLGSKANASALNSLTTKVNQVDSKLTAETSKVSTLQTTVSGHTSSIQQHAQSLNGLSAQWTLKVQSGGIVSGIGLASENGVSDFAIRADKFYIANPQGNKTPMFSTVTRTTTINGVTVPPGNYLSDAFIQNGSITNAHIANGSIDNVKIADAAITTAKIGVAQVDTLQIAGEAIVVPRVSYTSSFIEYKENEREYVTNTATINAAGGNVLINVYFEKIFAMTENLSPGVQDIYVVIRVKRDGNTIREYRLQSRIRNGTRIKEVDHYWLAFTPIVDAPPNRDVTYSLSIQAMGFNYGIPQNARARYGVQFQGSALSLTGVKR